MTRVHQPADIVCPASSVKPPSRSPPLTKKPSDAVSDRSRWGTSDILRPNSDLQTVVDFVKSELDADSIWRKMRANGHLLLDKKVQYVDLIVRLRAELKEWLASVNLL